MGEKYYKCDNICDLYMGDGYLCQKAPYECQAYKKPPEPIDIGHNEILNRIMKGEKPRVNDSKESIGEYLLDLIKGVRD